MIKLSVEERSAIAETIVSQLGGTNRLALMIGAKHFTFDSRGNVSFHFKMCDKANIMKFILNGSDLYDLEFYKYNRKSFDCPKVEEINDIYAEDLKRAIEEYTGLYLAL